MTDHNRCGAEGCRCDPPYSGEEYCTGACAPQPAPAALAARCAALEAALRLAEGALISERLVHEETCGPSCDHMIYITPAWEAADNALAADGPSLAEAVRTVTRAAAHALWLGVPGAEDDREAIMLLRVHGLGGDHE